MGTERGGWIWGGADKMWRMVVGRERGVWNLTSESGLGDELGDAAVAKMGHRRGGGEDSREAGAFGTASFSLCFLSSS